MNSADFLSTMEFPLQLTSEDELQLGDGSTSTNVLHFNLLKLASSPPTPDTDLHLDQISPAIINKLDETQGAAPLHYASMHGNIPLVTYLLENGADVDILDGNKKVTPLMCASVFGNLEVLKVLIAHNCDVNLGLDNNCTEQRSALVWAVKGNHPDVVRSLLDNNASQHSLVPFSETPMHTSVMVGSPIILEMLINAQGSNIKADFHFGDDKNTPLHLACCGAFANSLEMCRILVEQGYADISAQNSQEKTALHEAAESQNVEVVKFLLSHWANVDALDKKGKTPLFYTISDSEDALHCMETLIIRGKCNINHQDHQKNTALAIAAIKGAERAVEILLMNGADFSIKSGSTTALSILNRRIPDVKDILSRVFDSAVSVVGFQESGPAENRQDCKVKVNYSFVMPSTSPQASDYTPIKAQGAKQNGERQKGFDLETENEKMPKYLGRSETEKIKCLVDENLTGLLTHPVIHSFLELKWNKARYICFPALIFRAIFLLLFSAYIEMPYLSSDLFTEIEKNAIKSNPAITVGKNNSGGMECGFNYPLDTLIPPTWYKVMYIAVVTFAAVKVLMELLQIWRSPKTQLLTVHPWISWAVLLIICYMHPKAWINTAGLPLQRSIGAMAILFAWLDIWIDCGRFPVIGLSIRVFFQVFRNYAVFMMPHFCLLAGFTLSLRLLMPQNSEFQNIPFALTKIVRVMAGDITVVQEGMARWDCQVPSWYEVNTRAIFLYIYTAYVLIVAIVLANLLIGLAANDIQSIYTEASAKKLTKQTILINTLESNFGGRWTRLCLPKGLFEKFSTNLFHPTSQNKILTFKPFDSRDAKLDKDLKMSLLNIANAAKVDGSSSKTSSYVDVPDQTPSKHLQQWKMAVKKVKELKEDGEDKLLEGMIRELVVKFMKERKLQRKNTKSKVQLSKKD